MKLEITAEYLKEHDYDFTVNDKGHITLNGDFYCHDNQLTELKIPENFTCGGDFSCHHNQLTELKIPENFTCGGGFYCSDNQLTELKIPDNFTCGGSFYCYNNQLTKKTKVKTYQGVNQLKWRNGKYIKIDGIFCEVLKRIKSIFVCKKISKKNIFYIFAKNNVYAHGNTVKEAYRDWLFKTSKRDVSEYKNLDKTKEYDLNYWITAYRIITGACSFGTNEYLKNNQEKYKDKMTLEDVFTATKGQYGHNTFVNFFNSQHNYLLTRGNDFQKSNCPF